MASTRLLGWFFVVAQLAGVSLEPRLASGQTGKPLEPRSIASSTALSGTFTVFIPPGNDRELDRLKQALARHDATLVLAQDDQTLVDALKHHHVIALGNACNNPAVRKLYFEFFDWTDAAWPSPGGTALMTIVDPYGTGFNVIRVACSDDADMETAVDAFIHVLNAMAPGDPLPHLHQIRLGSLGPVYHHYLDPLLGSDFKWRADTNTWDLQVQVAHLGIGYLFTGDIRFLEAFRSRFLHYLEVNKPKNWLGSHGFMRGMTLPYMLTEHHPLWTGEDRRYVLNCIRDVLFGPEGVHHSGIADELKAGMPRGNHAARSALDSFLHARYLDVRYGVPEAKQALKQLDRYFRWQFTCCKPWEDSNGHQFKATMINVAAYALAVGDNTMIDSGTLRRAARRAEMQVNNLGMGALFSGPGASGLTPVTMLAMDAFVERDPTLYRTVRAVSLEPPESGPAPLAALALPYRHGDEFLRAFALPAAGRPLVRTPPEDVPAVADFDARYRSAHPEIPARGFDKITFRGGWEPADAYLLLDGMSGGLHAYENANCVLELCAADRRWISAVDWGDRNAGLRNQNGVQVLIDGLTGSASSAFAELIGTAGQGDLTATVTRLADPQRGTAWRRWIVSLRDEVFAVFDDVSIGAQSPGATALMQVRWFLHGRVSEVDDGMIAWQGAPGAESWFAAITVDAGTTSTEAIDLARSYRGYREYCGKWLFQDLPIRRDYPIDPESTPSSMTRITLTRTHPAAPSRWIIATVFAWGQGKSPAVPRVLNENAGRYSIADQRGELLRVRFDADTMHAESPGSQIAIALPPGDAAAGPIVRGDRLEPPVTTQPAVTARETATQHIVVENASGIVYALCEVPAGFVISTDSAEIVCVNPEGRRLWRYGLTQPARVLALWRHGDEWRTLIGDDAGLVTALGPDGSRIWKTQLPYSETVYDIAWAHEKSMLRDLAIGDLDADGLPDILAGVTDNHLYCLDPAGRIRWKCTAEWGTPTAIRVADLDHNGKPEVLFGTDDPSIMGGGAICDAAGHRGSAGLPWRLGVGDLTSFFEPASLTAALPTTIGNTHCAILGSDSNFGQIRCLDLSNQERWRLNAGARPLGIWSLSTGARSDGQFLAVVDSGYVFRFHATGVILERTATGQGLTAAAHYSNGSILLAGAALFALHEGKSLLPERIALPSGAHAYCLANGGPRPAAATTIGNRIVVFTPAD
jgi:hypothetical protein